MKKIIEKLTILFLIIIIILIVIIYNLISDADNEVDNSSQENITEVDIPNEAPYSQVFEEVSDRNDYYAVKNIMQLYYLYISYINGDLYIDSNVIEDFDEYTEQLNETGIITIQDMIDETYINSVDNIENTIIEEANKFVIAGDYSTMNVEYIISIENMYVAQLEINNLLFLVDIEVNGISSDMLLKLDLNNKTFSIFLSDYIEQYGYSVDMTSEDITIDSSDIDENDNNTFSYNTISDEDMSREYFNILKNLYLYDSERLYSLLDEEYSSQRFEDYDTFQQYIQDITDKINDSALSMYQVELQDDNTTVYRLIDNYNIIYSIEVSNDSILDYSIQLDDYTILSDDFIETYESATNEQKVQTNIETFFKMINSKDYNAAYNLLDDTFKQNNFATVDEFKEYAQNNFFDNTTITSVVDISQTGTYYACTIATASNDSDTAETDEETFIIALGEGTDFTLSFTIE